MFSSTTRTALYSHKVNEYLAGECIRVHAKSNAKRQLLGIKNRREKILDSEMSRIAEDITRHTHYDIDRSTRGNLIVLHREATIRCIRLRERHLILSPRSP